MVLNHFVTSDQNYGMPSLQKSSNLKTYTTLRKISRIGAFRVNVTSCSSYNDTCDILPSIRNLLYYFIGFLCRIIYVQLSSTCLCRVLLAQVCNFMSICSYSSSIYICISSFHIIKDKLAVCPPFCSEPVCTFKYMLSFIEPLRFVCKTHDVLSMLNFIYDSYACFFFSYTDFYFRKIRWSLFFTNSMYCISFGDVNIMHQIFVLVGIFTVYICMYVILASICVCACVYIAIKMYVCMCVFVVGQ